MSLWNGTPTKAVGESRSPSVSIGLFVLVSSGAAITGCTLLVTRLYSDRYGTDALSAILVFRLYGSFLLAFFALGMPIALQRTVAYLSQAPSRAGTAALVGIGIGTLSFGIACLISAVMANEVAQFMEHADTAPIWRGFLVLSFAQAVGTMIWMVQIARGRLLEVALVSVASMGVAPLLPLLFAPRASMATVMVYSAILAGASVLPSFMNILGWALHHGSEGPGKEAVRLLRYGLPRTIASAAEPGLDLALPWLALLSGGGLVGAGNLAIGLTLARPMNSITGAMGLLLTPASARVAAQGDEGAQAYQMKRIAGWSLHLGLFASLQFAIWSDVLIQLWLGPGYGAAIETARIVSLSIGASFMFGSVRGLIDGATERPVNTFNLLISFGVLVLAAAGARVFALGSISLAIAYVLSRLVLAGLTLNFAMKVNRLSLTDLQLLSAISLSVLLAIFAMILRSALSPPMALWALLAWGPFALGAFVVGMGMSGIEWARGILNKAKLVQ